MKDLTKYLTDEQKAEIKAKIVDEVIATTKIWAGKWSSSDAETPVIEESKLAENEQRLVDFFNKEYSGCNSMKTTLLLLTSKIIGVDLMDHITDTEPAKDEKYVDFMDNIAVVPVNHNPNSHHYKLGEVVVHLSDSYDSDIFTKSDGNEGNHLTDLKECIRPATEEEIREFFRKFEF